MSIQRFDYAEVVGDIDYAEGTYVRYEDHLSALENITGDIVDKAWAKGWAVGYAHAEEFFTNSCLACGYAGEWSTWICEVCMAELPEEEEEDNERS
jgi:hypothetical protein